MNLQELLQLIGTKEVELHLLRTRIQQLELAPKSLQDAAATNAAVTKDT